MSINGKEYVVFNREKLERLREAYNTALENGDVSFMFEDHELLVSFAGYLIEYLESTLKK